MRRGGRRARRFRVLVPAFAATALLATVTLDALLERTGLRTDSPPRVALMGVRVVRNAIDGIAGGRALDIAFLGDSLVVDMSPPRDNAPTRLQRLLRPAADVHDLSLPGLTLLSHYYLGPELARAEPDLAILSLNLASFGPALLGSERREMAGLLPASHWPEALGLPLHRGGVAFSDLVWFRALFALGLREPWQRANEYQARLSSGYWAAMEWAEKRSSDRQQLSFRAYQRIRRLARRQRSRRATPLYVEERLGPLFGPLPEDDPMLAVLGAWLRELRSAGVDVLVYAAPVNVDHLRTLDVYDEDAVRVSLGRIGAAVEARDGHFLDLHALLRDEHFRDGSDHLEEGSGASETLARALLAPSRRILRARGR